MNGQSNKFKLLRAAKPFQYLDNEEMKVIIQYGEVIAFGDNEPVVSQGKVGDGLYILIQGKATVSVKQLNMGEIELMNLKPGHFLGEINIMHKIPCTASVRSIGKSTFILLGKKLYDMLSIFFPRIRYRINLSLIEDVTERQANTIEEIEQFFHTIPRNVVQLSISQMNVPIIELPLSRAAKLARFPWIESMPAFYEFSATELKYVLEVSNLIHMHKSSTLFISRERPSCFIILSGAIKIFIARHSHLKVAVLGPNNFISSITVLHEVRENTQVQELFSYEACEEAILLEISQEMLKIMQGKYLELWYKIQDMGCRYIVSLQPKLNQELVRAANETPETLTNIR